jgi:hypothetical protein
MRPKERIPIFFKLVDFKKLEKEWNVKMIHQVLSSNLSKKVCDYWRENYDQRFGQVLINLGIVPDNFYIWNVEEEEILDKQGINPREYLLWGQCYDKEGNELPEVRYRLIKDLDTDHIEAILNSEYLHLSDQYRKVFEDEILLRDENMDNQ